MNSYPIPVGDTSLGFGVARPYRSNNVIGPYDTSTFPFTTTQGVNNTTWIEPGKFQIVAPGLNQSFGSDHIGDTLIYKTFPALNYYVATPGDFSEDGDNVTSFSEGQTIGDSVP